EGGAGVLKHLVSDPEALPLVARKALDVLHFDENGNDRGQAPHARERCEAACYDCLLSYGNQQEHEMLDRFVVKEYLQALAVGKPVFQATAFEAASQGAQSTETADGIPAALWDVCDSELERRFLLLLRERGHNL